MTLQERLQTILEDAKRLIEETDQLQKLQERKAELLGKKGPFAELMAQMKDLPADERPAFGQSVNAAKQAVQAALDAKFQTLEEARIQDQLKQEAVDVTLPGRTFPRGSRHLIRQIVEEIEDLFVGMGYEVKEGPEVESDHYNFEMLNLPKSHPARDMQDSFYITEETLLRTHTSPVQVRTLLENADHKPVRIICPGKVYRRDDDDMTHSHQFTQIEALVVDDKASFADLKGTLLQMARHLFGPDREIRLRPSYFPFTEPSVEVDVSCHKCGGKGCPMCKQTGWIEILGAGMVNNNVLSGAGYDPNVFQGFAFGVGVERLALLKYGIDDIRHLYTNDLRFNRQFR
jgi:phenylalanyl-tRNA synthetase alpha chain